jgi:hypothetical protein
MHQTATSHGETRLLGQWQPPETASRKFDAVDRLMLGFNPVVRSYKNCRVNGVEFRIQTRDDTLKSANSGIASRYLTNDGVERIAYGRIQRILRHRLYRRADSPVRVFFEVEWFDTLPEVFAGEAPVVRANPGSEWNRSNRYEQAGAVLRQNFTFWPLDPHNATEDKFVVISRRTE